MRVCEAVTLKWLTPAKMPSLEYKPHSSISSEASVRAAPEQIKNTSHHSIMTDLPLRGLVGQPSSHKFTQLFYLILLDRLRKQHYNRSRSSMISYKITVYIIYCNNFIYCNTCVTTTKILRTLISWKSMKPPFEWECFTHGDNVP